MTAADMPSASGFRHEALPYAGTVNFVARAAPIVSRAIEAGDAVLVAVDMAKIELLRDHLGTASRSIAWTDIRGIGGNPARIIPLWHEFVARHGTRDRLWGIGEPIWPGRSAAELVEAQRHEQLLNLAFADVPNFTLLCPYDTAGLDAAAIREGHRCHPLISEDDGSRQSAAYPGLAEIAASVPPFLPEPAGEPSEHVVGPHDPFLRSHLARQACQAGTGAARADDLVLAVAAVSHHMARPEAPPTVRVWRERDHVLAELHGLAATEDPLAGREWPAPADGAGRGLWLANQLCDLVQVRSFGTGAVVRLHISH
jgi:hypothetical protein